MSGADETARYGSIVATTHTITERLLNGMEIIARDISGIKADIAGMKVVHQSIDKVERTLDALDTRIDVLAAKVDDRERAHLASITELRSRFNLVVALLAAIGALALAAAAKSMHLG